MDITFKDIIDLAKAGYKPADVRELIKMSKEAESAPDEPEDTAGPEEKDEQQKAGGDDRGEPSGSEPDIKDKSIDYKALYEREHAALEKLQKENISKNIEKEEPSIDDIIADAMRGYM